MRTLLLGLALITMSAGETGPGQVAWEPTARYQEREPPAESVQFDFTIGQWEVRAKRYNVHTGEVVSQLYAQVNAEYRNDRRMIVSEWTGRDPSTGDIAKFGVTLRTYSPDKRRWHNVFLSSHQAEPPSAFDFRWQKGKMVSSGSTRGADGRDVLFRTTLYDITQDSYQFKTEYSLDGIDWRVERTQSFSRRN